MRDCADVDDVFTVTDYIKTDDVATTLAELTSVEEIIANSLEASLADKVAKLLDVGMGCWDGT